MPRKKIVKTEETKKEEKVKKAAFYQAVGRRKEATARVRLYLQGTGKVTVNNRPASEYFSGKAAEKMYLEPFNLTNTLGRFDVSVKVEGSGLSGQLGAMILGTARALEKVDKEKFRPILKKRGFLTRDSRAKERRKPGLAQKARKAKQSPKR